ncbi:hypothetical protein ENUP19_0061G0058 [Entamoeba nuttalli]|uniref:DH domain-containing protein n=2 Tax=Entamoeba nuttalli TaxID=412467 RepID=K2GR84_ENTNP|nr:hypothetical protein ENU1_196560 [Entamoeba nuttalli P19]EKE37473.1 hypothetical protein ENU1_196560 [Entamoeba nuttalli P19]|eukprot:XP_008860198.1 hypothetical protein ENU1_196560 [Entamoeba nuttalli P19]
MHHNNIVPLKPLPTPQKKSFQQQEENELIASAPLTPSSRVVPVKALPPKPSQKEGDERSCEESPVLLKEMNYPPPHSISPQSKSKHSVDLEKHKMRHRASVGSRNDMFNSFDERKKETSTSPNFFKKTTTTPASQKINTTVFDINPTSLEASLSESHIDSKDMSPRVSMLSDQKEKTEQGYVLQTQESKTHEKVNQKSLKELKHEIKPILPTDFLKKYQSYFTTENQEDKIRFIPKNLKGEKVIGDELMMHTAELVFTEFMFCVKLQIFQEIEKIIRNEIPLLDYQEYLLFEPLDNLVNEISQMCLELEPIYYNLLKNTSNKESELNNVFLIIAIYNSYIFDKPFKDKFKEFVAHYTSLGKTIIEFIKSNKHLHRIIQEQLNNCIDQNIKEITDLFFSATQRICRYELLFESILKEIHQEGKEKDILISTINLFKNMNISINQFISKTRLFYLKKYEYFEISYKSNISLQMINTIKNSFTCADHFIGIFYGIKNTGIKSKKTELLLFNEGILKRYCEEEFFEFYPINTLTAKKTGEWEKELLPNDVFFFDIKKNKMQIISLENEEEKKLFNSKVNQMFDRFKKSLNKH